MRLKGKIAIVTGGGSGMGRSACLEMAKEGAGIVVADLNLTAAETVAKEVAGLGAKALPVKVDQTKKEEVEALVKASVEKFGRLDVLFANAGIGIAKPLLAIEESEWKQNIDVNLNGTFLVCQAVARQMVEQKTKGSIIVNSSIGSIMPTSWFGGYCASKAGLSMLVRCLSLELGNYRIRVNAVLPGLIETPLSSAVIQRPAIQKLFRATVPAGRWGQAEDVTKVVTFLASDDSGYINGQLITIDGGWMNTSAFQYFYPDYTEEGRVDWRTEVEYKHRERSPENK